MTATKQQAANTPFRVRDYPFFFMHWIIARNNQNIGDSLRDRGITPTVWRVLAILQEKDGVSVNELAEASLIDRTLLSRILRDMERKRLVVRRTNLKDKRYAEIELTNAGRKLFLDILPFARGRIERALMNLSPGELAQLNKTLCVIINNLSQPLYLYKG